MSLRARALGLEIAGVAAAVLLLHWVGNLGDGYLVGAFDDDGAYTVLGKAIAEGRGYVSLHLAGSPVHVKYPPGFPFLLSLLWRATGSVEGVQGAIRWLQPMVLAGTAATLWAIGRGRWQLPWGPLLLLAILPLTLDATIQYAQLPLSEPWFLLGWVAVLGWWERMDGAGGEPSWGAFALLGVLIAGTILMRTQGVVLIPAVAAALAARRASRRAWLVVSLVSATPLIAWDRYHHALMAGAAVAPLPDEGTYLSWFAGTGSGMLRSVASSVTSNLGFYLERMGAYLTDVRPAGAILVGLLLLGTGLSAWLLAWRRPLPVVSSVAALGLVVLWPFAQDRLLLSVLPITGLVTAAGVAMSIERRSLRTRQWINVGATVACALVLIRQAEIRNQSLTALERGTAPAVQAPSYDILANSGFMAAAARWVVLNTQPSDRILIDRQAGVYLYTGRQTIPASPAESRFVPSVFTNPGRYLAQHILADSLGYLIIGPKIPGILRDIRTVTARCQGVLRWNGSSPEVLIGDPNSPRVSLLIYRVVPDVSCLQGLIPP